jgi:hypothetical protein
MVKNFKKHPQALREPIARQQREKAKKSAKKAVLCPKSRRPDSKTGKCPQSNQYKRPNEQGDMCCYKKPKKITNALRNKVVKAYKNANKQIPTNVINSLGIKNANKQIENDLNDIFSIKNGAIKIKRRICVSYTKPQLVKFATKLGIIVRPKQTKADICTAIYQEWRRRHAHRKGLNKVNILKNKGSGYMGVKIEGRKCSGWTKRDLIKWAAKRQIIINPKLKKLDVCRTIFQRANANSRFESEVFKKYPKVSVVGNNVLIHNRSVNAYTSDYLKLALKKLKINHTNNDSRYDLQRKLQVKYIKTPKISVVNGKLHVMNRNANMYTLTELKSVAKKLPNVIATTNASKANLIDSMLLTTNAGKLVRIERLSPNKRNLVKNGMRKTILSPDEILKIKSEVASIKGKIYRNISNDHRKKMNTLTKINSVRSF